MQIVFFGLARDVTGMSSMDMEGECAVKELKERLSLQFPRFDKLKGCLIAVNEEYASDERLIKQGDTVAIIPPVSGG